MSIADHFGKRKQEANLVPMRPTPPSPPPRDHSRDAQAIAMVTALHEDNAHLRDENGRLRADLNLALMRCRDLERSMHDMSGTMESYRRYSIEVRTHLEHIVDCVTRAQEAALSASEPGAIAGEKAEQVINKVEAELRNVPTEPEPPKPAA